MEIPEGEARQFVLTQLKKAQFDLRDLENRLRLLQEILVVYLPKLSEAEPAPEPPDLATHFHSVLGCWLRDYLSPLVREVGMLLVYPYPAVELGAGSPGGPEPEECRS